MKSKGLGKSNLFFTALFQLFRYARTYQKLTDSQGGLSSLSQPMDRFFFLEADLCGVFLGIVSAHLINKPSISGRATIRNHNPVKRALLPTKSHQPHRYSHIVLNHLLCLQLENWNIGMLECWVNEWNIGTLEYWKNGKGKDLKKRPTHIPLFHHSIIPVLLFPLFHCSIIPPFQ
jgi:hypothetical protein